MAKKYVLVKWTAKIFFLRIAIKQLFQWVSIQLTQFTGTNLMFWSFKKDFLGNAAEDFMLLVLKWRLASFTLSNLLQLETLLVPISLALGIRLITCQFSFLFLWNCCMFFWKTEGIALETRLFQCYWLIHFGYTANYKTQGTFAINFLIYSNFFNFFRSVGIIFVTVEVG